MDDLRRIRELLVFLRTRKHSLDEALQFVALDTLFDFGVSALLLNVVQHDGTIQVIAGFGCDLEVIRSGPQRLVSTDTPFNRLLRTGEIGECCDDVNFDFIARENLGQIFPHGFEYSFSWPIQGIGAVMTFCSRTLEFTIENQEFLMVVGSLLSYEFNKVHSGKG